MTARALRYCRINWHPNFPAHFQIRPADGMIAARLPSGLRHVPHAALRKSYTTLRVYGSGSTTAFGPKRQFIVDGTVQ
jgi:hypothetical protein